MKKVYMYAHGGSGNHGCEAIVRATIKIMKKMGYEKFVLISSQPEEDIKYGLGQLCEIVADKSKYSKFSLEFLKAYLKLKVKKDYTPMDELSYMKTISMVNPGDIVLSIGGDNYCYADVEKYVMLHNMMLKRGAKTVLWGCSVEPEVIDNSKIAEDLGRYSLIVARESISYEALKKVNENIILASDPAFFLESIETAEEKDLVGINLSPMAIRNECNPGMAMKCYRRLIQYIINNTKMDVVLVPHVVWEDNDDRIPLESLYDEFRESNRIEILSDCSCEEIKGIIKKCMFFVGARTHSTIAAYSTEVPTLVIGYSVKARGIAKDIFGEDNKYIIPVQNLNSEEDIVNEFIKIMKEKEYIVNKLIDYKNLAKENLNKIHMALNKIEE